MPEPYGLYLVLSNPRAGYERCTEAAVAQRVRYVQLRIKGRPQPEVLAMAARLRAMTRGTTTRFIVNDDLEVAMACDADGLHLGQGEMHLAEARSRWTVPGKLFGLSTHSAQQARDARAIGPDYIGIGPVFATPTKQPPDPALGPVTAARIALASPQNAVAIGGIDAINLRSVLSQGIVNFAVVRAVCDRSDPAQAIDDLQSIWRDCVMVTTPPG